MTRAIYHGGTMDGETRDEYVGRYAICSDGYIEERYEGREWDEETDTMQVYLIETKVLRERTPVGPLRGDDPLPQEALDMLSWLNTRLGDQRHPVTIEGEVVAWATSLSWARRIEHDVRRMRLHHPETLDQWLDSGDHSV